jgi:hypothetical protein
MVLQRLIDDAFNVVIPREIRIKTNIVCLLNYAAEARKAATDVKHAVARCDPASGSLKFLPDRFLRQKIALKKARMELRIKFAIPFNHRIEEIKSGRRFPQSKEFILTETRPRGCAKNVLPPGNKIFGVNPLHVPDGRLAGDGALRIRHIGLLSMSRAISAFGPGRFSLDAMMRKK